MKIVPTALAGVMVVEVEPQRDARGLFARSFDADLFQEQGMAANYPQCNISWNAKRGTLRGMHYQAQPKGEPKLIRCTRGRVFDVALDLRPQSPTYCRWVAVELDAESRNAIYIPEGCAHGFQTLSDDCELLYQMGETYVPELARGVRWNDPAFAIEWPLPPVALSERDANYPDFQP
jgi:dTDP-4-dehydrorhamnose 3,5-epimerase